MHNMVGWTNDPILSARNSASPTAGVGYYGMVYLQQGAVVSYGWVVIATAGSGLTSSYMGLYNATTQLAVTGAITTTWQSTGAVKTAFTSPYTVPSTGYYFVAVLIGNGSTTPPIFIAPPVINFNQAMMQVGQISTSGQLWARFNALGSGLTSLPASISGTPLASVVPGWMGLS